MKKKLSWAVLCLLVIGCSSRPERIEVIQGKLAGHAVTGPVKIIRDQYGFPHVRAERDEDVFYGLGYAMAQDRFFQLDLLRRAGRGELCELLGRLRIGKYDLLEADRIMRVLNYKGRAEAGWKASPPEAKKLLQRFTDGVNRYLADAGPSIGQYHLLKARPAPWRPEDSYVCAEIFGLAMTAGSLGFEYSYSRIAHDFGPDRAKIFIPEIPAGVPTITGDRDPGLARDRGLEDAYYTWRALAALFSEAGSNNWVVAPKKSASGAPIIANDPHVPSILLPSYWYHCHLQGGSFNVIGMMFPGYPAFGAAYNGDIAWALTNGWVDQMDLFLEKANPANPNQYECRGAWREFSSREELIPMKNGKPVKVVIQETVHGPALRGRTSATWPGMVYSLAQVQADHGRCLQGYLDMARARDWAGFEKANSDMMFAPFAWNHAYADRAGNIGYQLTGLVPIRPDQQGVLAREGWTGAQDWQGYVPFAELPRAFNPARGYIATANNRQTGPDYPYYVSFFYRTDRITRIDEVLRSKEKLSREDMQALQMDVKVVEGPRVVSIVLADLADCRDSKVKKGLEVLRAWQQEGYFATVDSAGPSLYVPFLANLGKLAFRDELGSSMITDFSGVIDHGLKNIIDDPDSPWWDNVKTNQRETRKDIMEEAMKRSVKLVEGKLGPDPKAWQWGKLQKTYIGTTLGLVPGIGNHALAAKLPREGIRQTVNNSESMLLGPLGYLFFEGPTTRMVVDFADPGRFYFTAITGNSENIASGRMANTSAAWANGNYQVFSMKEEDYEKGAMGTLEIMP